MKAECGLAVQIKYKCKRHHKQFICDT